MADATQRPDVRLEIDGKLYGGWKATSASPGSLEQCAGTFELSVTDRWPQQGAITSDPAWRSLSRAINHTPVITGQDDVMWPMTLATPTAPQAGTRRPTWWTAALRPRSSKVPGWV